MFDLCVFQMCGYIQGVSSVLSHLESHFFYNPIYLYRCYDSKLLSLNKRSGFYLLLAKVAQFGTKFERIFNLKD